MKLYAQEIDALTVHNAARAAKRLQPLQWDTKLAKDAMAWARVLTVKRFMEHATKIGDGENLYQQSCGDCTYSDGMSLPSSILTIANSPNAVRAWLAEEPLYTGQVIPQGNFHAYGHFTQCMWSGTTHVGMGWARTLDGMTFIVARYAPAGNFNGEKPW